MIKKLTDLEGNLKTFDDNLLNKLSRISMNEYRDLITIPGFSITISNTSTIGGHIVKTKNILTGSYKSFIKNKNDTYIYINTIVENIYPDTNNDGITNISTSNEYMFDFKYFVNQIKNINIEDITI